MTHGSHWECIVNNIDIFFKEEIEEIITESIIIDNLNEYGFNIGTNTDQDNEIHSLLYPPTDYPVKILSLLVNKQLWSSYPIVNYGMTYEVIIEDIIDESNLIEGQISCKLKNYPDFTFSFFDTMYYRNKSKYQVGDTYSFIFNGFMYSCDKNDYDGKSITNTNLDGNIYLDKNSVIFLSNTNGDIDDFKVISPILNVEKFENIYKQNIYKIEILLLRDDIYFNIPVIVSENNLKNGFIPEKGESLNGSIWLCGVLKE